MRTTSLPAQILPLVLCLSLLAAGPGPAAAKMAGSSPAPDRAAAASPAAADAAPMSGQEPEASAEPEEPAGQGGEEPAADEETAADEDGKLGFGHGQTRMPPSEGLEDADREWLVDEEGREYYIERIPREEGKYKFLGENEVKVFGVVVYIDRYDDDWFYLRKYRPEPRSSAKPRNAPPTPEEVEAVAATYRPDVGEVDRLQLVPFDRGLPTTGQWRNGFDIADMNGDGHPDIVHSPPRKGSGIPVIMLGDGAGSWHAWSEAHYTRRYDYGDVAVADYNGDGRLDIALGIHLQGLRVLVGNDSGRFSEWSRGLDYQIPGQGGDASGFSSRALAAVDWTGDGLPDIVALSEGPRMPNPNRMERANTNTNIGDIAFVFDGVALFLNQGDGTWKKEYKGEGLDRIFGDGVALGDFNGDGRVDFATASSRMGRRDLVNLKLETGGWSTVSVPQVRPFAVIRSVAAADFDADGLDDLAVAYMAYEADTWRSGVDVLYPRKDGTWERRVLASREGQLAYTALGEGDLDGDGARDLVALDYDGGVSVFLGDGKGSFVAEASPEADQPRGRCQGYHVELADLDGDGRDDLVANFAGEPSAYFDPDRCGTGGGIAAWKTNPYAPEAAAVEAETAETDSR